MDALDVKIIRAMGIVPYGPTPKGTDRLKPSSLARAVGTSVNTVKARVAALEKAGILAGYQLVPNLRHLGLAAAGYRLRVRRENRKNEAVTALQALPGLLELHDFLGPDLCADVAYRDDADQAAKIRRLVEITEDDPDPPLFYSRSMPPVKGALDALDWRILQALRWKANRPLSEVAKEIGVSHWTVKRRYESMARDGDFFQIPMINPGKAEGLVPFEILLFLKPGAQKEILGAVLKEFNSHAVYVNVPSSPEAGHFFVFLFARSTAEVDELVARARALPGVDRAEPMFFRGAFDKSQWLDELIDARAKAGMP